MNDKIKNLCDVIQKKLGNNDKSLHDLLEILFDSVPGDTWWNVRDAYDHMVQFFRPPPMTIEEFTEEMTKRNFVPHFRPDDSGKKLFTLVFPLFDVHVFTNDSRSMCHSQLIYKGRHTVASKKFVRRLSQDTVSLAYPFEGMLSLVDTALKEIPIFTILVL